jgi:transposase
MVVLDSQGQVLRKQKVTLNTQAYQRWLQSLQASDFVALEASTNSFTLYDHIAPVVKDCYVLNPRKLPEIYEDKIKYDYKDAEKLAERLWITHQSGNINNPTRLPQVFVPPMHIRKLRKLFSSHRNLKQQIAKNKNLIHSLVKQEGFTIKKEAVGKKDFLQILQQLSLDTLTRKQIEIFYQVIVELEIRAAELERLILSSGDQVQEEVRILCSIPGISCLGALAIISDIADIRRFYSPKNLCSYLRSAPGLDSSNKTAKVKRINKCSRKLTMSYLIQGIHHIRGGNPNLDMLYHKLRSGKSYGKAVVAIARHTITHIFYMLRDKKLYLYVDPEKHNKKMKTFEKILKAA